MVTARGRGGPGLRPRSGGSSGSTAGRTRDGRPHRTVSLMGVSHIQQVS